MLIERREIKKPFELIMIQPTPYCNINCDYCYLSEERRNTKDTMSDNVLRAVCNRIFKSKFIELNNQITFLWHAGEPLSLPISYYENALSIIEEFRPANVKVYHSVLTNGITLNDKWCQFFKRHDIEVGISVDGPEFLHNKNRKTKNQKGTFHLVKRGLDVLKRNDIPPYALSTIHGDSLNYPEEIFNFFIENNIKRVGLNFEEIIGHNQTSSLNSENALNKCRLFIERFYELYEKECGMYVREFDNLNYIICKGVDFKTYPLDTITPLSILTIDCDGNFSTFAPELADMKSNVFGDFIFGNVCDTSFEEAIKTDKLKRVYSDIREGVKMCQDTCEYYEVCGANLPAHKLTENGTMVSTETLNCKVSVKLMSDVVIDKILAKIVNHA
jgi:uncharacterized protein